MSNRSSIFLPIFTIHTPISIKGLGVYPAIIEILTIRNLLETVLAVPLQGLNNAQICNLFEFVSTFYRI